MSQIKTLTISVKSREGLGKGPSRRLRSDGYVPAVIYGHGSAAVPVALAEADTEALVHHPGLTTVEIEGGEARTTILKDVQRDRITYRILHLDLQEVKADEKVRTFVAIEPHGHPAGSAHGGQLEQILHELEIECLPADLPETIVIEVSAMGLDETMHVSDLVLPEGIAAVTDEGQPVFQVRLPRTVALDEEEAAGEEEAELGAEAEGEEGEETAAE